MARVTIEDCLNSVSNRFELVLLASKRARQLDKGAEALVNAKKDKSTVIALREISEGLVRPDNIEELHQVIEPAAESAVTSPFN